MTAKEWSAWSAKVLTARGLDPSKWNDRVRQIMVERALAAEPETAATPLAPVPLVHVSRVVVRSLPNGASLASCGAEKPTALVVSLKDSNCLECWKYYYGDDDGERHFRNYHPETR